MCVLILVYLDPGNTTWCLQVPCSARMRRGHRRRRTIIFGRYHTLTQVSWMICLKMDKRIAAFHMRRLFVCVNFSANCSYLHVAPQCRECDDSMSSMCTDHTRTRNKFHSSKSYPIRPWIHVRHCHDKVHTSPAWSKASCSPMSGPLIRPVRASRMGWNKRLPFLPSTLPFA